MRTMKIEDFGDELQRLAMDAVTNIEKGINEVAEDLLSASQKLAPLDEGGLMENGTVEPAIKSNGAITAKVGYNKKYALRMHEGFYNLGATSARKSGFDGMTVGRKFLSQPITAYSQKYMKHILDKMVGDYS
ncbi:HK97 gp10 family phage protein [Psychrobacillus sp. L3]|uniref:HK97 gp10 family phage protein n=1 Tax=Psychrobacillus sp. L3 TaxID=3236891 RepID=UPI0036F2628E